MKRLLVVGAAPVAGADDFYRRLLADAAHVVAADGAGEWCVRLDRIPDVVVGDFDSAQPGAEERLAALGAGVERHPSDKDLTDLELAVDVALARWETPVCLTAAFTGRIDHTLAAIGLLVRAGSGASIAEPGWRGWACAPGRPVRVGMPPGTTFSVIAVEPCTGVNVSGGRWDLRNHCLDPLSGRGVSNEAAGGEIAVTVATGRLVVMTADLGGENSAGA